MYLQFDPNKMHLQVVVGTLEEYSPNDEVKEIQELVNKLTEEVREFKSKVVDPQLKEIIQKVDGENKRFQDSVKEELKSEAGDTAEE